MIRASFEIRSQIVRWFLQTARLTVFALLAFFAANFPAAPTLLGDLDGDSLDWLRPVNTRAASDAGGFNTSLNGIGSRYRAPALGERLLALNDGAGNASFAATHGGALGLLPKD